MEKKVSTTEPATTQRTVGRRKTAAARIRFAPGTGTFIVNGRELANYFPLKLQQQKIWAPLVATGKEKLFDVSVKVAGGGITGQAEAIAHGLARALVLWNPELRPVLRAGGFMTRDPRAKERKKFGHTRARRGHQWRKR